MFPLPYFNSIKVRLEPASPNGGRPVFFNFNSIKVRLELAVEGYPPRIHHFNSIKVRLELSCAKITLLKYKFQFHKGTIRTEIQMNSQQHDRHFNSIKVRLEHLSHRHMFTAQIFQFHKGTIRTL